MKIKESTRYFLLLLSMLLTFSLTVCGAVKPSGESSVVIPNAEYSTESNRKKNGNIEGQKMRNIKITVGNKVFKGKLYNNE